MDKRQFLIGARLVFGTLVLIAVGAQINELIHYQLFNPVNFLSYFTNLSNILAAVAFILGALFLASKRKPSVIEDVVRGAAVLYMVVTGIIYVTLLSGEDLGLLIPWVNVVLHYVMPVVVLLDWLYQPPRHKLELRQTIAWLVFPAAFLAYSLMRGPLADWYPYPFLDPAQAGGYIRVAVYCLGILIGFLGIGWLIAKLGNTLKRNVT